MKKSVLVLSAGIAMIIAVNVALVFMAQTDALEPQSTQAPPPAIEPASAIAPAPPTIAPAPITTDDAAPELSGEKLAELGTLAQGTKLAGEAQITIISSAPEPTLAPYKDCLVTLQAKIIADENGALIAGGKTINLVTWGFRDRTWQNGGLLQKGCRIKFEAIEFFEAPNEIQSLQLVDSTEDHLSPQMWVTDWQLREGFLRGLPHPPTEELVEKQTKLIKNILMSYQDVVVGGTQSGWFFDIKNTDHYKPNFWKNYQHSNSNIVGSYRAILEFHKDLQKRGIQLHVAVGPRSSTIFPDIATNVRYYHKTHGRINTEVEQFIAELKDEGVSVIDLTPPLLEKRWYTYEGEKYPVFLPNDHHWSPRGVKLAARAIAGYLIDNGHVEKLHTYKLKENRQLLAFSGFPYNQNIHPPYPDIPQSFDTPYFTLVPENEEAEAALEPDQSAPVQLMGDSFIWCHKTGNNLRSHLIKELGQPLAFWGVNGAAETQVRRRWAQNADLSEVKHLIWVVGENSLGANDRWHLVPLGDDHILEFTQELLAPEGDFKAAVSDSKGGIQIGTEPVAANLSKTYHLVSKPLDISEGGFFECDLQLVPASDQVSNQTEYRFILKAGAEILAEQTCKPPKTSMHEEWQVDLSKVKGNTAIEIEVEIVAGENGQEAYPVLSSPKFAWVKSK